MFKDTIITDAVSNLTEVAEDPLTYFVVIRNRECFAAILNDPCLIRWLRSRKKLKNEPKRIL